MSGVFFTFFALARSTDFFIELCLVFLIIELLLGNYQIRKIPPWLVVITAICSYLLLVNVVVNFGHADLRNMKRLAKMMILVFAIHCLSQKKVDDRITLMFGCVLVLSVCWQFTALGIFGKSYGTFTNPHRLATFAALAFPLILYFFLANTTWYRFIFIPVAILDAHLLLQTGSHPALWTIVCVALLVLIIQSKGWYRWLGIILVFFIIVALYISDYRIATTPPNNPVTLKNLSRTLAEEERVMLWKDSWKMLMDNTLFDWIVGNGIGSFRERFMEYVNPTLKRHRLVFPHSFFLEILHQNGIVGFILVFGGFGFIFSTAILEAKKILNKRRSILLKCMIAVFLIWFVHCGLTFPFYSTFSLYPLGLILGTTLVALERIPHDGVVQHDNHG